MPSAVLGRAPRFPRAVSRARLLTAASGPEPGVLLVGPAGTGKTVLAAQLVERSKDEGRRGAWVRTTPGSARAVDLVTVAAVSLGRGLSGDVEQHSVLDLAGELLGLLEAEPTTLVVDDYHHAFGEECDPLIAEVLGLLATTSHVVICSRTRPPGLVGRSAEGLLRVIATGELAFTEEEATALFTGLGCDAADGARLCVQLGGWAAGLVAAAEAGTGPDEAVAALLTNASADERACVEALSVLPYLTDSLVTALGLGDRTVLSALAERTLFVTETAGQWRLQDIARVAVDDRTATDLRRRAAVHVEPGDPELAVELLLAANEHEAAADVLARHLSSISVDRVVGWLYRLPAELRRQFPPVAAGGKATVDLDEAVARAQARVDSATDDDERREARFALGSALAHAGALSSAAGALEAVLASGGTDRLADRARTWLAIVRWWAGDLVGARAALAVESESALFHWTAAEVALAEDDLEDAHMHASRARVIDDPELSDAPALSVLARLAWLAGDVTVARGQAQAAYRRAAEVEGFELAVAAPPHAWMLIEIGHTEEALAVAELVERRIGRHDAFARVHAQLIRLAAASVDGDREAANRAQRRVRELRALGFAPVEAQARRFLTALGTPAEATLSVFVLGATRVEVDQVDIPLSAWKSHKAWEVLVLLALAGERGAHREQVIESVWPDRDPEKGRMLLRAALSEIRRRLEPGRQTGESSNFVTTTGERVLVRATVDWHEAQALAREGRSDDALALFHGELAADLPYAEWIEDERRAADVLRADLEHHVSRERGSGS